MGNASGIRIFPLRIRIRDKFLWVGSFVVLFVVPVLAGMEQ